MAAFARPKRREPLDEEGLFQYAVGALARRMRTVRDLRRLMGLRAEEGETGERAMDAVVRRLEGLQYLSDERFAADYTRLRKEGQSLGQMRVRQDLAVKGVPRALVTTAVDEAYEGTDEVDLARRFCERKRIARPVNEKETARLLGRLQRAGFRATAIWKLLRGWDVAVEETDVEDAEREAES